MEIIPVVEEVSEEESMSIDDYEVPSSVELGEEGSQQLKKDEFIGSSVILEASIVLEEAPQSITYYLII